MAKPDHLERKHRQLTQSSLEYFAEQPPEVSDVEIEKVYYHMVAAKEPQPLCEASAAPDERIWSERDWLEQPIGDAKAQPELAEERVWTAEDWFEQPAEKLFAPTIGDWQPRNENGEVLTTAERLAITAGADAIGHTPIGRWVWASPENNGPRLWIAAGEPGKATLVGAIPEPRETRAFRDLPSADGIRRQRGTEHIDRPSQPARITALALHAREIAATSGIEVTRGPAESPEEEKDRRPGQIRIPRLAAYRDGDVRATLGPTESVRTNVPDLINEVAAITIARAWQQERRNAEDAGRTAQGDAGAVGRATVSGLIASHQLIQSAGVQTITSGWAKVVTAWVEDVKKQGGEHARDQIRRTVELTGQVEADLRLPRNDRQLREAQNRAAARGDERPSPVAPANAGSGNPNPPGAPAPVGDYASTHGRGRETQRKTR